MSELSTETNGAAAGRTVGGLLLPAPAVRVPPVDALAERAVLGSILLRGASILAEVAELGLTAEDFATPDHAAVYAAAVALDAEGEPIDSIAICDQIGARLALIGGPAFVDGLMDNIPATSHASHYAAIVRQKSRLRSLILRANSVAAEAYTTDDPDGFLDGVEGRIADGAESGKRPPPQKLHDVLKQSYKAMMARRQSGDTMAGISTGFPDVDAILGGLEATDYVMFVGRPGMAKTSALWQVMLNAAKTGTPGMIFELEMPAMQLGDRSLANEARLDLTKIRTGFLKTEELAEYTRAAGKISDLPVWIDCCVGATIAEIRSRARRWLERNAPKRTDGKPRAIVAVDYGQLVGAGSGPRGRSREGEVAEVSRGLRQLALSEDIAVMPALQLNRDLEKREDKRPTPSDIRESGSLEQDASKIVGLYRDEYYRKDKSDKPGIAEWIVLKNRNGQTGTAELAWCGPSTRFDSLSREAPPRQEAPRYGRERDPGEEG